MAVTASLDGLGARLARELGRLRADPADPASSFRGLYIDESEAATAIADTGAGPWEPLVPERLAALQERFALTPLDVDILLATIAPELDSRYERIYAFLQDDITRRRATVALLIRLLADTPADETHVRAHLQPDAPLLRSSLLAFDASTADLPLFAAAPHTDERVVAYLLGLDGLDGRLFGHTTYEPHPTPQPLARSAAEALLGAIRSGPSVVALRGVPATGKRDAARLAAATAGLALLVVDVPALLACPSCSPPQAVRLVMREALVHAAAVYWSGAARLWEDGDLERATLRTLEAQLQRTTVPTLLGGDATWEPPSVLAQHPVLHVRVVLPSRREREERWRDELGMQVADAHPAPIRDVAASFRLSARQVGDAARIARSLAAADGAELVRASDLYAAGRAVSGRRLASLGRQIEPRADWSHLVLPDDSLAQLRELCATVRHRARVLEEWGFDRRLSGGKGVTALFSGTSGTGKTMAAEVIAQELQLALFRIDLAGIVSKWIGETEKNLDRIFDAAADSNAILFFDEADALFGKRSEVKDSHDRYANLEISYLLQKMESYDGLAILATNMRQQLDDAFLRRLGFTVIFPLPEEAERARIWAAVWPAELPRADDVDLAAFARVRLAGGNIKNVVLSAAYLAAAGGRPVGHADLVHGIRREFQKLGKQTATDEIERVLTRPERS